MDSLSLPFIVFQVASPKQQTSWVYLFYHVSSGQS